MKDFFILLWILLVPLVALFYQVIPLIRTTFISTKGQPCLFSDLTEEELLDREEHEIFQTLVIIFSVLFVVWPKAGEVFGALKGLLAGEIIVCDLMTLAFYYNKNKSILKKTFTFLFVFINFWISALWFIQDQLSPVVLWISVISYPIFGLSCALPYFLKGNTS